MTRVQPLFLVLLTAALMAGMPAVGEAQITVSLPELIGDSGERIDIPVTTDDLTDLEVTAFFFTLAYDPEVVSITDVFTEGTLSEGMTLIANTDVPGELRVAASRIEPLAGGGVLLELKTRYVGRGDSELRWVEFAFNEGDPAVNAVDGSAAVRIGLEGGIGISLPDIAGLAGESDLLSVEVEELGGQEVYSYLFSLAYDPRILRIGGVSTGGTISEGMSVQANSPEPGRFAVAASGADALAGAGSLIDLEVEFIGGGTSPLRWTEFVFNERDPAPSPTDAQATANGEIVFSEIHNGPGATVDWVEMLVVADVLDLRGYRVRGANGEGYEFADDPVWEDLRRGTLVLVGGNDSPLPDDDDPGDFVVSVRHDPFAPGLLSGDLVDIQGDADVVEILRPSEEPVFTILWGGAGPAQGFYVDLGADPLPPEANVAFAGGDLAGVTDAAEWEVVEGGAGTLRQGNGPLNEELLSALRGGAEIVSDVEIGLVEVALPTISGQVGRITMAPVQVTEVTGLDVLSYLIAIDYDPEIVKITEVSVEGTISAEMSLVANVETPGRFTVAASSAQPLRGVGSLLDLEIEYVGPGTTELILADLQVNEGEPRALGIDGEATARVGTAAGVGLRLPETTGTVGQTVSWPIEIDDVTGLEVTGFLLAIAYDPLVVDVTGFSVAGAVAAGMTIEANTDEPGQVIVAGLQTAPLSGSGVLLELQAEYVGRGTTDLEWTNFTFNEGEVAGAPTDGRLEVQNAPLQAADDDIEVEEDTATSLAVLANDDDPDGDPLMVSWVSEPEVGTVEIDADSTRLIYTPPEDYNGPDRFSYEVNDGIGDVDTAFVNIAVLPANDPPVGVDNEATALQDSALIIFAVANDLDPDGDQLVIESVTQPANGTVVIGPDNISLIYTPNPGFRGQDTFTYRLIDGDKAASEATVTVEVLRTNDAPVAADDAVETQEDTPVVIQVLEGDTDADGDELTVTEVGDPANGTVALDTATGEVTYTPAGEYSGPDSFTYTIGDPKGATSTATVNVTVTPVNDAPVAVDDAAETDEDASVIIPVLVNDTDADGDELTVTEVGDPANGTVVFDAGTGEVTYTPNADYNGPDSFTYTIGDGEGATSTATVNVTVTPVSDPPVAVDDAGVTDEDVPVIIPVVSNDMDADGELPVLTEVGDPANGSVAFDAETGEVTYTPNADYNGPDSFTYTIGDAEGATSTATVSVTVGGINDDPVAVDDTAGTEEDVSVAVAVVNNDTDADGETPTLTEVGDPANGTVEFDAATGEVTYTPNADYNGSDSFTYTIGDAEGARSTATVSVSVTPVNDAPVATDDAAETDQEEGVTIAVVDNDFDVDGEEPAVDSVGQPGNGTVEIDGAANALLYTPDTGFSGEDSFTYTIVDAAGATGSATVTVTVNPEQIPPALVSSNPGDAETELEVDPLNAGGLVFLFSEPIATGGVQAVVEGDGQPFAWEPSWSADGTQLTLMPAAGSELIPGTVYQVTLTQVLDLKGNDAGVVSLSFETEAALAGDVNGDGQVDVRDAILTLRLAAGLPMPTPPSGHVEPTPYERLVADVNEDGSIDEADALLTLGVALGRIASKPALAQSGSVVLRWGGAVYEGEVVEVPVRVEGYGGVHAGNIRLSYRSEALQLQEVKAGNAGSLMAVDDRIPGELGISLVNIDGLVAVDGAVALLRFRVHEGLRAQGRMQLEGGRFFDATARRIEVREMDSSLRLVPPTYALFQNAPNPFNPSTDIRYQLPEAGRVRLVIYDLLGRTVRVLADDRREAGYHLISWDGRDETGRPVGSGIYLLRLEAGGLAQVRKMTLMR